MTITSALVLFAVIWFMVLFILLPLRLTTQAEDGRVLRGTPASAPVDPGMRGKLRLATAIAVVVWAITAGIILSGWITVEDLDVFGRLGPEGLP